MISHIAKALLDFLSSDLFAVVCVIVILISAPVAMWISLDKKEGK